MELLVAPLLFIAVILFVAYPFLTETKEAATRQLHASEQERLFQQKEDAISALKDIEMDFQMGKLSQLDYENLKARHEQQAVSIFKQIDKLRKVRPSRKQES